MSTQKFSNNADSFLSAAIPSEATSFSVIAGDGALFPELLAEEHCYVRIGSDSSNEVVKVTARDVDTLLCEATVFPWAEGSQVSLTVSAEMLDEFVQVVSPIHGVDISDVEISDYVESIVTESPVLVGEYGTLEIDLSVPYHVITLDMNVTKVSFTNLPPAGTSASYMLEIIQGTGAPWSITWPASIKTPGGESVALQAAINEYDLLVLTTRNGGTSYSLMLAGAAFS